MSIKFKRYPIKVEHDGTTLRGTIVYWSKDYRVVLDHPVHREGKGIHMMYMIPARFVTPLDTDTIEHVGDVNIVIRCKEELKRLYSETTSNA